MENNDNPQPENEKKCNFWPKFFPANSQTVGNSELHSSVRQQQTDYITENIQLKKELEQAKIELTKAQARATSYAVVIEDQAEQLNEFKERFQ